MPTYAHPCGSLAPTIASMVAQIGAVTPPRAIDQNVTATVNVMMPTGSATTQYATPFHSARVAEHGLDAGPPALDLADRHERVRDVGVEQGLRSSPLDRRHHPHELEREQEHDARR